MTPEKMNELFNIVLAGWPTQRQKLSPTDVRYMAELYAAGLMDLDFAAAHAGVIRLVHTAKFLPTVAEIREAAGVVIYGHEVTGLTAWGEVQRAIKNKGSHRRPGTKAEVEQGLADFVIENPIALRVIRTMGWQDLCAGDHDTMVSNRARFSDEYDVIAGQERTNTQASFGMQKQATALPPSASRPRELEWKAPADLPSGEERSKILHDVLDAARHNAPTKFGELADAVLKDKRPGPVTADDLERAKRAPFRCMATLCGWEGHPAGSDTCPKCGLAFNRFFCIDCNHLVTVDDDGCCKSCGIDAQVVAIPPNQLRAH